MVYTCAFPKTAANWREGIWIMNYNFNLFSWCFHEEIDPQRPPADLLEKKSGFGLTKPIKNPVTVW